MLKRMKTKMGRHKEKLASFEMALRAAGIEKYNLVKVSSITPPNCKIITKESGKIVRTSNITQTAMGDKNSMWTTVVAAAVFIPE